MHGESDPRRAAWLSEARVSRGGARRVLVVAEFEIAADVEGQLWDALADMPDAQAYAAARENPELLPVDVSTLAWALSFSLQELLNMEAPPGLEEEGYAARVRPLSDEEVEEVAL